MKSGRKKNGHPSKRTRKKRKHDVPDAQFYLSFLPNVQQLRSLEKLEVRSQIQSVVPIK